jgi:uncharacterized DUF497 family protein
MTKRFDRATDEPNKAKHGISPTRVADFVEVTVMVDDRFDYGETRYRAWGHIAGVAHCLGRISFCWKQISVMAGLVPAIHVLFL